MKYLTVGLVVASAIALLGTGCHKDPYAPYAVHTVLEPDSLETFAGELPSFGIPTEYITHYREPHWLLVRMALDAESGAHGLVMTVCIHVVVAHVANAATVVDGLAGGVILLLESVDQVQCVVDLGARIDAPVAA